MSLANALSKTLAHEGGYSDHPHDRGGPTNYGITEAVAREHGYNGAMRDMPIEAAKLIYEVSYWNRIQGDHIDAVNEALAEKLFDIAVNSGVGTAGKLLQRAINVLQRQGPPIAVDGVIGGGTLTALRRMPKQDLPLLVATVRYLQAARYIAIAEADASQKIFIRGWLSRVTS